MLFFISSVYYATEIPVFIQKYKQNIPSISYNTDKLLTSPEKAHLMVDYLCKFMPDKTSSCLKNTAKLTSKLTDLIDNNKPIVLILLGFPFKSRNHEKKCLSAQVDIGEYLALMTLHCLVQNITLIYPHTHCTIISDGLAYHVDDYDDSYEHIVNYHKQINELMHIFPSLSFVSWKINDEINSYKELQQQVASVALTDTDLNNKIRYNEMKAFVLNEFKCNQWETSFMQQASIEYEQQYPESNESLKLKNQKIRTIKNALMLKKIESIVPQLVIKGKQFSTFISTEWPRYQECIRLSVHKDKDIDMCSKIPINLVYDYQGTPWHNTIVVDEETSTLQGFAKDIYKKELDLGKLTKKSFVIEALHSTLSLSYIVKA